MQDVVVQGYSIPKNVGDTVQNVWLVLISNFFRPLLDVRIIQFTETLLPSPTLKNSGLNVGSRVMKSRNNCEEVLSTPLAQARESVLASSMS